MNRNTTPLAPPPPGNSRSSSTACHCGNHSVSAHQSQSSWHPPWNSLQQYSLDVRHSRTKVSLHSESITSTYPLFQIIGPVSSPRQPDRNSFWQPPFKQGSALAWCSQVMIIEISYQDQSTDPVFLTDERPWDTLGNIRCSGVRHSSPANTSMTA